MKTKKKSDFLKIAQGLGIAIPASLLLATNVNATPVNTVSKGIETTESTINLQEENEVMERIAQTLTVNDSESNYLLASDDHAKFIHSAHTDHTDHANHGATS